MGVWWRVRVAFGQSATAADPTYTDVSAYIRKRQQPLTTQGGQEREQEQEGASLPSGQLTLDLDNSDHRFTTGQSWALTDSLQATAELIVDGVVCPVISGWILLPEQDAWTENDNSNLISITIVDRLGREQLGQEMDSLLTEHIRAMGGSRLVGYWPLGEAVAPVGLSAVEGMPNLAASARQDLGLTAIGATFTPGGGVAAPGDELVPALWSPTSRNTAGDIDSAWTVLTADFPTPIEVSTGQVLTLVAWTRLTDSDTASDRDAEVVELEDDFSTEVLITRSQTGTGWFASLTDGSWTVSSISNPRSTTGRIGVAMLRVEPSADPQYLTVGTADGASTFSDTPIGSPPASLSFTRINVGAYVRGSIWHVQVYLADAAEEFTAAELTAQIDVGFHALANQRVDERIATLASYAGIDPGDLVLDECVARMQALATKGKLPVELMATAVTTEQGRLFADGDRRLVLHSRRRRYAPSDH
jgi:hypothetical protein